MQKILFVITKSNWGGAQRYVFDLATTLPKTEYEAMVALGGSGSLKQKLTAAGIRTSTINSFQRDISLIKEFKALRELIQIFKNEKPDVVHLNSSKAGGIGALAARISGVRKVIFTVHGLPEDETRGFFARLFIKIATRITCRLCTHTITVSQDNHKRLPGSHLIYNGIGPMSFGQGDKIRSAFPAGVKITGTIGELTRNKNQVALIEEAKQNTDLYVAIVGEGELRKELEEKIKRYDLDARIKLFGFMPVSEVLKGFDVFILPSLKEGLPYVLLEARTAGLPIVANRVGGVGEILDAKDLDEFSLEQMVKKTISLYRS